MAAKKGAILAARWYPGRELFLNEPFPLIRLCSLEQPGAVKGAPLLGAVMRTLDSEDCSHTMAEEGKAKNA
jgi:hypothetical protein